MPKTEIPKTTSKSNPKTKSKTESEFEVEDEEVGEVKGEEDVEMKEEGKELGEEEEEDEKVNIEVEIDPSTGCARLDLTRQGGGKKELTWGEETVFVNAAVMDVSYRPVNRPWVVDLDLERG